MKRFAAALALASVAAPAAAAPITITKAVSPVADGVSLLNPRVLPGGTVEVALVAANPLLNPSTIANVTVCDVLPATMTLLTADMTGDGGPVAFAQGLVGSGLAYAYVSLAAANDGLALYDADDQPIAAPGAGSDPRVRKLCVTLTGTRMTGGGSFTLRYRARVR